MQISISAIFIAAVIISCFLEEHGYYRYLNKEEKARLMDYFLNTRVYYSLPRLALACGNNLLITKSQINTDLVSIGCTFLSALIVAQSFIQQRKINAMCLPSAYQRIMTYSHAVLLAGEAWFLSFTAF